MWIRLSEAPRTWKFQVVVLQMTRDKKCTKITHTLVTCLLGVIPLASEWILVSSVVQGYRECLGDSGN